MGGCLTTLKSTPRTGKARLPHGARTAASILGPHHTIDNVAQGGSWVPCAHWLEGLQEAKFVRFWRSMSFTARRLGEANRVHRF
jgi:hypothetical protein